MGPNRPYEHPSPSHSLAMSPERDSSTLGSVDQEICLTGISALTSTCAPISFEDTRPDTQADPPLIPGAQPCKMTVDRWKVNRLAEQTRIGIAG